MSDGRIPALTLWRPWTACFTALPEHAAKRHENRSWGTSYRGPVFLHAGQRWDSTALQVARRIVRQFDDGLDVDRLLPAGPAAYPTGVVAVADLVAVCSLSRWSASHRCDCGPWAFPGQWHWRFANVRALPEPVPCRGAQQLWYPPADVVAAVEAQLAEAVAR